MNSMLWPWAAMQQAMGNMPVAPQAAEEKKPE
jgi:hypothetical protein